MADIIQSIHQMHRLTMEMRQAGKRIGVVPTMGALHEGHLSLIREGRKHADVVITTVFVNPAQFGAEEDFERYPRNLERDTELAGVSGSAVVFAPDHRAIYPEGYRSYVDVTGMDAVLEGKSRPGHFRGVATIVLKLLHITHPHCVVFGQKDAQQVVVIRRMLRDLNMDVEMIVAPTVRESDGLAMSSRNVYLTETQRREATVLYRALELARKSIAEGTPACREVLAAMTALISSNGSGVIDYISIADAEMLQELGAIMPGREILVSLAVRFGNTRLIDNILVKSPNV
jgi:pantoate--beta-alanine ligase